MLLTSTLSLPLQYLAVLTNSNAMTEVAWPASVAVITSKTVPTAKMKPTAVSIVVSVRILRHSCDLKGHKYAVGDFKTIYNL